MKQPTLDLRFGTELDVEDIVNLGRELYNSSVYATLSRFDEGEVRSRYLSSLKLPQTEFINLLLQRDGTTIGFISCCSVPQTFSEDRLALEIAFWITPSEKSLSAFRRLLEAYYYWAKLVGCKAAMTGRLKDNKSVETYVLKRF